MHRIFIQHLYNILEKRKLEKWRAIQWLLGPRVGVGGEVHWEGGAGGKCMWL